MTLAPPRVSWKRVLMPSTSVVLWLAVFLSLFLSDQREELVNTDGDICWHVAMGQWMWEHGEIIVSDPFSHTRENATLITHDWGSEVLLAAVWKWLGWAGIAMVASALIATLVWMLHRQLLDEGNELILSTVLVLMAAMACSIHWLARPLLITHLLFCFFHGQLRAFDRSELSVLQVCSRLGFWMVVWVNVHGAFFAGFALIAMYAIGAGIDRWRAGVDPSAGDRRKAIGFVAVFFVCVIASLANPNGWRLHAHIVQFLRSPLLTTVTPEFASPDFHTSGTRGFLLLLVTLALLLMMARARFSSTEFLLVGGWGLMALYSTRNIPLFAIVTAPVLARHWRQMWTSRGAGSSASAWAEATIRFNTMDAKAGGNAWIPGVCAVLCLYLAWGTASERLVFPTELREDTFPVAAVNHLAKHGSELRGEMFNEYDWGGYLSIHLPGRKVFTDGRNDFYGAELVKEYLQIAAVTPSWERVFARYNVGWVIMPLDSAITTYLSIHPEWSVIYKDRRIVVLGRAR